MTGKIRMAGDKIQKAHGAVQQASDATMGKALVVIGGSGITYDQLNSLTGWLDLFIKVGSAIITSGGLYMMFTSVQHRYKKRQLRKSRSTDGNNV